MKAAIAILLLILTFIEFRVQEPSVNSVETKNSEIIRLENATWTYGLLYQMNLKITGNEINWSQVDTASVFYRCDYLFNYSITIDSLHAGNYWFRGI